MHERTRRRICQSLFVAFCLIPTLGTSTWALVRATGHAEQERCRHWAERLASTLHTPASWIRIGQAESPAPNRCVLQQLEVGSSGHAGDAERNTVLGLESVVLDYRRGWFQWQADRGALQLAELPPWLSRLTLALQSGDLNRTHGIIRQLDVQLPPSTDPSPIAVVSANEAANTVTLYDVQWSAKRDEQLDRGKLSFRMQPQQERVELRFAHDRDRQWIQLQLHTMGATMPVQMLQPLIPSMKALGASATFRGSLAIHQDQGRRQVQLRAFFRQVDLQTLIAATVLSSGIEGMVDLNLDLDLDDGQVTRAIGLVENTQPNERGYSGSIHTDLVMAGNRLGLSSRDYHFPALIPFRQLAIHFSCEQGELTLQAPAGQDAMLRTDRDVVLWRTTTPLRVSIVQALDEFFGDPQPRSRVNPRTVGALRWFRLQ